MSENLAEIIAKKTAEIEEQGICQWTYRKPCRWCSDGYEAVPSSVSDSMVHPDTPIGRIECSYPRELFENFNKVWDELESK